ncbi:CBS domain-containing protein [Ruania albidiflava]|uniref:CBS domain-containing protein n=1 Tax=Ruania albidiflava TaxID=366586 RepID=UPI0003B426A5|nr:CBS domain-containing protein [Ruania albidiflava]
MTTDDAQPLADQTCENPSIGHDEARDRTVGEVMVKRPKTLPLNASVAEAREFFTNPKVLTAVLVEGEEFAGLLDRDTLPDWEPGADSVAVYARTAVPTITPDRPVSDAVELMKGEDLLRLVVLDQDGRTLRGLLCIDHDRTGFCQGS